jgi:hypothetical protein
LSSPFFYMGLPVTKHFLFFIREDLRQLLAEKIPKILKSEIAHKIPQTRYVLMEPVRE